MNDNLKKYMKTQVIHCSRDSVLHTSFTIPYNYTLSADFTAEEELYAQEKCIKSIEYILYGELRAKARKIIAQLLSRPQGREDYKQLLELDKLIEEYGIK